MFNGFSSYDDETINKNKKETTKREKGSHMICFYCPFSKIRAPRHDSGCYTKTHRNSLPGDVSNSCKDCLCSDTFTNAFRCFQTYFPLHLM